MAPLPVGRAPRPRSSSPWPILPPPPTPSSPPLGPNERSSFRTLRGHIPVVQLLSSTYYYVGSATRAPPRLTSLLVPELAHEAEGGAQPTEGGLAELGGEAVAAAHEAGQGRQQDDQERSLSHPLRRGVTARTDDRSPPPPLSLFFPLELPGRPP